MIIPKLRLIRLPSKRFASANIFIIPLLIVGLICVDVRFSFSEAPPSTRYPRNDSALKVDNFIVPTPLDEQIRFFSLAAFPSGISFASPQTPVVQRNEFQPDQPYSYRFDFLKDNPITPLSFSTLKSSPEIFMSSNWTTAKTAQTLLGLFFLVGGIILTLTWEPKSEEPGIWADINRKQNEVDRRFHVLEIGVGLALLIYTFFIQ
jgi:hypothetical protein